MFAEGARQRTAQDGLAALIVDVLGEGEVKGIRSIERGERFFVGVAAAIEQTYQGQRPRAEVTIIIDANFHIVGMLGDDVKLASKRSAKRVGVVKPGLRVKTISVILSIGAEASAEQGHGGVRG